MRYNPRLPAENDNVTQASPMKELALMLGGGLVCLVAVYWLLGLTVDLIVPHIPAELEHRMLKPLLGQIDADKDAGKTAALQALADRLSTQCTDLPFPVTVRVSSDKGVNAVALPGGTIIVFSGLLDKVSSENALAFVLGHEMGHFANRDHLRGFGRALVLMAISAAVFGADSRMGDLFSVGVNLNELRVSRDQETRADAYAAKVVTCAYGHLAGAMELFENLKREEGETLAFGHYLSTHPDFGYRIERMQSLGEDTAPEAAGTPIPLPEALRH